MESGLASLYERKTSVSRANELETESVYGNEEKNTVKMCIMGAIISADVFITLHLGALLVLVH